MAQFEKIDKGEKVVDFQKIAKEYSESIRNVIKEYKEKSVDIHFQNINPDELTEYDLAVADKFLKGNLTEEDFEKYKKEVSDYCRKKQENEKHFDEFVDSRANLRAWISNKILSFEYERRHPEQRAA